MVKKFNDFILESKKEDTKPSYGCMMLFVKLDGIDKLHSKIKKDDIYEEENDDSYGIETDSHITIKYGFTDKVSDHDILDICRDTKFSNIKFNKISLFENEKFDVLKFDVDNDVLTKLNKKVSKFPNEDKYPDYHAHSTIAYIKKGIGKKYVEMFKGANLTAIPSQLVYSNIDDTKLSLDI